MTNTTIGLKETVAQHSNIACKSVCFGLIKKLYYQPTNSSLKSIELYFGTKDKDKLLSLFLLQGEALISFTKKCTHLDEKTNGNLLLEAFVSSDRQFMALQLSQYSTLDYQLLCEPIFLEGSAAELVSNIFL
jgi:hypothetical protein